MEKDKNREVKEESAFDAALETVGGAAKTFVNAAAAGAGIVAGMYAAKKVIEIIEGDEGENLVIEV